MNLSNSKQLFLANYTENPKRTRAAAMDDLVSSRLIRIDPSCIWLDGATINTYHSQLEDDFWWKNSFFLQFFHFPRQDSRWDRTEKLKKKTTEKEEVEIKLRDWMINDEFSILTHEKNKREEEK